MSVDLATIDKKEKRPKRWGQWVAAAFVRSLGGTQEQAAKAADIGVRSLERYEKDSRWPEALEEAHQTWLGKLDTRTRAGLLKGIQRASDGGEMEHLKWIAERRFPELAPPSRKTELTGPGGGPVPIIVGSVPFGIIRDEE